jgi:ADP-ribosylation factor protein 1
MLGPEAAGKSTILSRLQFDEVVPIIPTVGYTEAAVQRLSYERSGTQVSFTVLDVSGSEKMRPLWRHCYKGKDGIIFVVDSSAREDVEDARLRIEEILDEVNLMSRPLLVLANKQDQPGALSPSQLAVELRLHMVHGRAWSIEGCCANTGDGIYEGLDWLAGAVVASQKGKDAAAVHAAGVSAVGQRQTSRRLLDDVSMQQVGSATPDPKCYGDLGSVADSESTVDTDP